MNESTVPSPHAGSTALVRTSGARPGTEETAPAWPVVRFGAAAALLWSRFGIDRLDTAVLTMIATRRRLAAVAGTAKRQLRHPVHDSTREAQVLERAIRRAARLDVSTETTEKLMTLLMADARERQTSSRKPDPDDIGRTHRSSFHPAHGLLRLMPPPKRWRVLARLIPRPVEESVVQAALSRVLVHADLGSSLECVEGRTLGIEVEDLGLHWTLQWRRARLKAVDHQAEATVRGTVTDLLLLASRLEDADTLFFQRRLVLTGDTELGLTIRNLLDRMPWEALPLGMRIMMHRTGLFARAARRAYHH